MTAVLQKKICMLGAFAVGKTSLVRRYVDSIFSDSYLTTVGVKIDKRVVTVGDETVNLILWDIAGEDEVFSRRARACSIPIWLDTQLQCGHAGTTAFMPENTAGTPTV